MRHLRLRVLQLIGLALLLLAPATRADQFEQFGDLQVHYVVFNTMDLDPEMASRYGIRRAANRALLNISGRRENATGLTDAVPLDLRGRATNLLGQSRALSFEEVIEPGAVYYLATLVFADRETLRFELDVTDRETGRSHVLRFQQELWKE